MIRKTDSFFIAGGLLLIKFLQPKHFLGNFTHFYLANFACHRHWKTVGEVEKFGNFEMRKMLCKKITLLAMHSHMQHATCFMRKHSVSHDTHKKQKQRTQHTSAVLLQDAFGACSVAGAIVPADPGHDLLAVNLIRYADDVSFHDKGVCVKNFFNFAGTTTVLEVEIKFDSEPTHLTFSPPLMIMSFILPTMLTYPSSRMTATSPVAIHPSLEMHSRVFLSSPQ